MDRKTLFFKGASLLDEYVAFKIECGIENIDVAGSAISAEKFPDVIDGLLSKHSKKDLAFACALSDYFYVHYNKTIGDKSRFISVQVKCAQEALDQQEPAAAIWQANMAALTLLAGRIGENTETEKTRNEVIQVLRNIFNAEGNHYGYAAIETLRILEPSPKDRTAESDKRITGTAGSALSCTQK